MIDETGLEVLREQPRIDVNTPSMAMCDDFRAAVEEGTHSVRMSRAIFGYLA